MKHNQFNQYGQSMLLSG